MRYPVTIRVNGEPLEIAGPVTIGGLLAGLTIDARLVAVEHNLLVVKRDKYESAQVGQWSDQIAGRLNRGGLIVALTQPGSSTKPVLLSDRNDPNGASPGIRRLPRFRLLASALST